MKLNYFLYKITRYFKKKGNKNEHTKQEYSIKNMDIHFFDIPCSCYLVIKKYGWVVFFYKTVNYLKILFKKTKSILKNFFHLLIRYIKVAMIIWKRDGFIVLLKRANYALKDKVSVINIKSYYDTKIYNSDRKLLNYGLFENWRKFRTESRLFAFRPLISIILPVYNVEIKWLKKAIDSVLEQFYENWELCIVDDASIKQEIKPFLKEYARNDGRIKVRFLEKNLHISGSSNEALKMANGEFIALLDNDDELTPDALFEVVSALNINRNSDILYSDEDKIGEDGSYSDAAYKPDWDINRFLKFMYTGHLAVYRKKVVDKLGGFRLGFEGSQDYDLMLRASELTKNIYHIKKILYHWRTLPTSVAINPNAKNYAYIAGKKALQDYLDRNNIKGEIVMPAKGLYEIAKDN